MDISSQSGRRVFFKGVGVKENEDVKGQTAKKSREGSCTTDRLVQGGTKRIKTQERKVSATRTIKPSRAPSQARMDQGHARIIYGK